MENNKYNLKEDKRAAVESMFDSIAWRYDFLNHFLSFGIDRLWRRRAIRIISRSYKNPDILDVATGTGDLAIAAMKIHPLKVTGIDISTEMLKIGKKKIEKKGFSEKIELVQGDSEKIPFDDNSFDVAMVAFGVRNFADPLKGLSEMNRVIRPGGMIVVLEFSKPSSFPFKQVYNFYFRNILPLFGRFFSKDKAAYSYLPDSVMQFPDDEKFLNLLRLAAFSDSRQRKLTGGVASIYTGIKFSAQ
ncbi:MAG TPA: bifunctional demethylmenaquinone methyltransferase/2-methoxy-6-polyprenyl-1,4-benzoquinol methylase UbiE [Bacteroidales bacterium]|nr:bifunctional demethylmenaquinone methyltransferase/2-methoxy-6-polyprenyl-1,4-benzoquinol methylase UbiE [Bacteroidales bacterium]